MFHKIFLIIFINLINFNVFGDNNRIIRAILRNEQGKIDFINSEFTI